jgi:rhodanese-related sulfurtransferase
MSADRELAFYCTSGVREPGAAAVRKAIGAKISGHFGVAK